MLLHTYWSETEKKLTADIRFLETDREKERETQESEIKYSSNKIIPKIWLIPTEDYYKAYTSIKN